MPEPISIWQPQSIDGRLMFIRPKPLPLGDHYATQLEIQAEKAPGCRRICFFGESVAAGYLYAPHLTPATLLSRQLNHLSGPDRYEVVDLSRTNEQLDSLVHTVRQSLQLRPDLLAIFAGNNWNLLETRELSTYFPSVDGRRKVAAALRDGGMAALVDLAVRTRLEKVGWALSEIDRLARGSRASVVLVIPEVNLVDWQSRQPIIWLPDNGVSQWYARLEHAQKALAAEDWSTAVNAVSTMLDLDEGLNPTPFRLLFQAQVGLGRDEEARTAAEAEVSANHYATMALLGAPQATSLDKEVQRRAASIHGFKVVDLPTIFASHTNSSLTDRRLFLDYCHLTAEGMQVAMAAVSAAVLELDDEAGYSGNWSGVLARLPASGVSAEADATAAFGAAIHTAHRLTAGRDKAELLAHWCRTAVRHSAGIADTMVDLAAARLSPAPAVLTTAQQRNLASPYRLQYQHGWRYDYQDALLITVMAEVLATEAPAANRELLNLLSHHLRASDRRPGGHDLCRPPSALWEPMMQFYPSLTSFADVTERAMFRAPWPVSEFYWAGNGARAAELELTARLTGCNADVRVEINGHRVGMVRLTNTWSKCSLSVPSAMQRRGFNKVTLHWPLPAVDGREALANAIDLLERGLEADLHPVFGEIFSLRVG